CEISSLSLHDALPIWERALNLVHAGAHQLERVRHVRRGREGDRQLARTSDGMRLDARHARHYAHRFFQGARHAEHDLPGAQARRSEEHTSELQSLAYL